MMRTKILVFIVSVLLVCSAIALVMCNRMIVHAAEGKLYSSTDSIPYRHTGLLLGTNKYIAGTYVNPYYSYRIDAAVALLRSGKITCIIVSGDNGRKDYDEPAQMRADLIAAGVDSTLIYMDDAGFRTFDSMVRAREIFGQDSVTVISQPFHNERALYIASREGISAIAFNAQDVSRRSGLGVRIRERFARVKVFVDYIIGTKPRYLGDKIVVG